MSWDALLDSIVAEEGLWLAGDDGARVKAEASEAAAPHGFFMRVWFCFVSREKARVHGRAPEWVALPAPVLTNALSCAVHSGAREAEDKLRRDPRRLLEFAASIPAASLGEGDRGSLSASMRALSTPSLVQQRRALIELLDEIDHELTLRAEPVPGREH